MQVHHTIASFRAALDEVRHGGAEVGLVPTMGYLHDGHLSLMRRSADDGAVTAVTIFVNPLQFGPNEDLASYPRDLDRDLELCRGVGADHVFAPDLEEMYRRPMLTTVSVAELGESMEGSARPTHFDGVTTVVAKLFGIAGPCRAYFGEKDFQQLAIVRRMVDDLAFPVAVVGCPIVREPDGLAMSSRNVYLSQAERAAAPVLYRALRTAAAAIEDGERDRGAVTTLMSSVVESEPLAHLDYAEAVDAESLESRPVLEGDVRLLVAARFGTPRLLDNLGVHVPVVGDRLHQV